MGNYLCNMTADQRRSRLKEICEDASYISLSKQLLDVYLQSRTPGDGGRGAPSLSYQRVCLFQTQEDRRRLRLLEQGYPNAVKLLRISYELSRHNLSVRTATIPSAFREDYEFFMYPINRLAILFERAATCEEGRAILDAPFYGGLDCMTTEGTNITVLTLTGKRLNLQVPGPSAHLTTLDLKEAIQSREGIPPSQQRLIYNGTQLQDHVSIEEYGIQDNALLHLVLRLRGGCCSCCLDSLIEPAPNSVGVPLTATVSVQFTCGSSSSNVSIGQNCICSNASGRNDQRTLEYANNNLVVSVAQQRPITVKRHLLIRTRGCLHLSMVRYDRIELWGSFLVNRRLPKFLHEIVLRFLELDPSQWYSVGPQMHVAQKTLTLGDNDAAEATFNRDTANVVFEVTPPGGEWAANTTYRVDISYEDGEADPVLPFNRTFSFVTAGANGEGQEELVSYQEHDAGGCI